MTEAEFQAKLIKKLKVIFSGCEVLKNDPTYIQGMPDLTIFYGPKWATLEVKKSEDAPVRPNQEHYVKKHRIMSFSSFIYPENEEEVLERLIKFFKKQ